ncbi:unnamed protein product [Echinostoma caproni]|uniref:MFS domain-containing protein n=1 Tax=Echinostoma caproni TaxID=27848 RepID=A0A183A9I6_9TREM|nr:unnamed protein product [Echinostoma caproni]
MFVRGTRLSRWVLKKTSKKYGLTNLAPQVVSEAMTRLPPFAVALCNRFNDQGVVMSGGVLCFTGLVIAATSLGLTLVYTPSLTICTTYFKRKRSTALSLSLSGAGFAALTLPYLIVYLIDEYAYSGAVLLLGAISLHYCVTGALFRDPPHSVLTDGVKQEKIVTENNISMNICQRIRRKITGCFTNESQRHSYKGILRNPWMVLFLFSFCLNMMGSGPVTTLLIHHAENLGFQRMVSVQLLAIEGIVQIVFRVFGGLVLDIQCVRPHRGKIWSVTIALSSLTILFLAFAEKMAMLSFLMSLRGVTLAVYISQQAVITADMCEKHPENLKQAIGLSQIGKGVGVLVGSWCAGSIRDITQQYRPAFLFLSGMQFIGALTALMAVTNVHRSTCGAERSDVKDALLEQSQNNQSELRDPGDPVIPIPQESGHDKMNQPGFIAVQLPDCDSPTRILDPKLSSPERNSLISK